MLVRSTIPYLLILSMMPLVSSFCSDPGADGDVSLYVFYLVGIAVYLFFCIVLNIDSVMTCVVIDIGKGFHIFWAVVSSGGISFHSFVYDLLRVRYLIIKFLAN